MKHEIISRRVYELKDGEPGCRVLVDRLWPRGVRREALGDFRWAKGLAPSPELRRWFGHAEERFDAFAGLYRAELDHNPEARAFAAETAAILERQDVLLLYAAKSPACNHAVVLKTWLLEQMKGGSDHA